MRVLVTGSTGFIGAHVVRKLVEKGHQVFSVVRDLRSLPNHGAPIVWDLAAHARPDSLPTHLDAIAHVAQSRKYRHFPGDASEMFKVNVFGTAALLDYAVRAKVRRFCLISSGTVYEPFRGELKEDAPLEPTSYLGATKLAAEHLARPYGRLFQLSILRLFFPYGPGQRNRLLPELINRVRNGTPIQLASDGEGLRLVPTFIDDIAEVIATALAENWSGTINVSTPAVVTLRQLAEGIARTIGANAVFEATEQESKFVVPCLDQLRARFDLNRFTPLDLGLQRTLPG
jgi:UDP-glucose 4-epimerase